MAADTPEDEGDFGVALDSRPKTKRPPLYKVLILNDDYTPMEFVIMVLERFFGLTHQESFELMLTVHKKGLAVVGVYSREIAETKVAQVLDWHSAMNIRCNAPWKKNNPWRGSPLRLTPGSRAAMGRWPCCTRRLVSMWRDFQPL